MVCEGKFLETMRFWAERKAMTAVGKRIGPRLRGGKRGKRGGDGGIGKRGTGKRLEVESRRGQDRRLTTRAGKKRALVKKGGNEGGGVAAVV